ncbi:MAG: Rha family transcriptional regulator [Bacteroidota bacterium]
MSELSVNQHPEDNILVVDSRLIATQLGIEHESFIKTVKKYEKEIEQAFGILRFEIGKIEGRGRPSEYIYLTEEQAIFLTALSRNTSEVVECKKQLVLKFSEAKRLLRQQGGYEQPHTTTYIKRLEKMGDHKVSYELWTTFREGAEVLLKVEKEFKVPVDQMDLCDGSIGRHWSAYRKDKPWAGEVGEYIHRFRDRRGERPCRAYNYAELPQFRRWLEQEYIPRVLPQYLVDKYGKRAVYQIYEEQGLINEYIAKITEEKRKSPRQEELHIIFLAAREAIHNRYLFDF